MTPLRDEGLAGFGGYISPSPPGWASNRSLGLEPFPGRHEWRPYGRRALQGSGDTFHHHPLGWVSLHPLRLAPFPGRHKWRPYRQPL